MNNLGMGDQAWVLPQNQQFNYQLPQFTEQAQPLGGQEQAVQDTGGLMQIDQAITPYQQLAQQQGLMGTQMPNMNVNDPQRVAAQQQYVNAYNQPQQQQQAAQVDNVSDDTKWFRDGNGNIHRMSNIQGRIPGVDGGSSFTIDTPDGPVDIHGNRLFEDLSGDGDYGSTGDARYFGGDYHSSAGNSMQNQGNPYYSGAQLSASENALQNQIYRMKHGL